TPRAPVLSGPGVVRHESSDALASGSTAAAANLLADDVWWENVGLPVARGRRAVVKTIGAMLRRVRFDVRTHHLAVGAPADPTDPRVPTIVLTERTDTLAVGPL